MKRAGQFYMWCYEKTSSGDITITVPLTGEYLAVAQAFNFGHDAIERLALNAVRAILLPPAEKARLVAEYVTEFGRLRAMPR